MRAAVTAWLALTLAGCGIQKAAEDTLDAVRISNETQKQLLHGIHLQTLSISLEKMLSPENTEVLHPPLRMMPFAATFAAEATSRELIETIHTLWMEARLAPPEQEKVRRVSVVAMSALSAFASRDAVRSLFRSEIEEGGLYEETACALGAARWGFIRDYLLGSILENAKVLNLGTLRRAADLFESLKELALGGHAERLRLEIASLGVDIAVEPGALRALGRRAKRRFVAELPPETLAIAETQALLGSFDVAADLLALSRY